MSKTEAPKTQDDIHPSWQKIVREVGFAYRGERRGRPNLKLEGKVKRILKQTHDLLAPPPEEVQPKDIIGQTVEAVRTATTEDPKPKLEPEENPAPPTPSPEQDKGNKKLEVIAGGVQIWIRQALKNPSKRNARIKEITDYLEREGLSEDQILLALHNARNVLQTMIGQKREETEAEIATIKTVQKTLEETIAERVTKEEITLEEALQDPEKVILTQTLVRLFQEAQNPAEKTQLLEELLARNKRENNQGAQARTLVTLARSLLHQKDYEKALEHTEEAIATIAKEPNQSIELLNRAIRERNIIKDMIKKAQRIHTLKNEVKTLSAEGRLEEALHKAKRLLRIQNEVGSDPFDLADTSTTIQSLQTAITKSVVNPKSTIDTSKPLEDCRPYEIERRCKDLLERGQIDEAEQLIERGETIHPKAREIERQKVGIQSAKLIIENPSRISSLNSFKLITASYPLELLGQYDLAIRCLERLSTMTTTPENTERNTTRILRMRHKMNQSKEKPASPAQPVQTTKPITTQPPTPTSSMEVPSAPEPTPTPETPTVHIQDPEPETIDPVTKLHKDLLTWFADIETRMEQWETIEVQTVKKRKGRRKHGQGGRKFKKIPVTKRDYAHELEETILGADEEATQRFLDMVAERRKGDTSLHGMLTNNLIEDLRGGQLRNNGGTIKAVLKILRSL